MKKILFLTFTAITILLPGFSFAAFIHPSARDLPTEQINKDINASNEPENQNSGQNIGNELQQTAPKDRVIEEINSKAGNQLVGEQNQKLNKNPLFNLLSWHTGVGIALVLAIAGISYAIWHWRYFKRLLNIKNK